MNSISTFLLHVVVAVSGVVATARDRFAHANRVAAQRGSLSLEQIIWTVALALVAVTVVALVVTNINNRAATLTTVIPG